MPSASSNDSSAAVRRGTARARARAADATPVRGSRRRAPAAAPPATARAPARWRRCAPCAARASPRRPRCDAPARPRACRRSRAGPSCAAAACPTLRAAATCSVGRCCGNVVQSKSPVSVTLPASALPWPPMYLVSALTTRPASTRLRLEQPRRRHRVVDDVEDAARPAQLADAREVRHLHARIGDRLDEHEPRRGRERRLDLARRRSRRRTTRDAVRLERQQQAVRVAEHELARRRCGRPRAAAPSAMAPIAAMPVANADGADAAFHRGDLGLERRGRRIALAPVRVARRRPGTRRRVRARRGSRRPPTGAAACAARRARSAASRSEWRIAVVKPRGVPVRVVSMAFWRTLRDTKQKTRRASAERVSMCSATYLRLERTSL